MPKRLTALLGLIVAASLPGCSTLQHGKRVEYGPDGTIAYMVQIESSEPGARIEANNDYVGNAPMTLRIWGDSDGTFHNFGSQQYVLKAYPVKAGEPVQTKIFRTGGWWSDEDRVPSRVYFDFTQHAGTFSIDLPPVK